MSMSASKDFELERQIVSDENYTGVVQVKNLTKVYNKSKKSRTIALENTTFGMYEQECFALLGVNGAGKSSTFKILTNEIEKTSGTVRVMDFDIDTGRREITKNMGYCP